MPDFETPTDAYDNGDSVTLTLSKESAHAMICILGFGFTVGQEMFPSGLLQRVDEIGKVLFPIVREIEPEYEK